MVEAGLATDAGLDREYGEGLPLLFWLGGVDGSCCGVAVRAEVLMTSFAAGAGFRSVSVAN